MNEIKDFQVIEERAKKLQELIAGDSEALACWHEIQYDFVESRESWSRIITLTRNDKKEEAILETLTVWMKEQGEKATFESCLNIFQTHELGGLVEKLRSKFAVIQGAQQALLGAQQPTITIQIPDFQVTPHGIKLIYEYIIQDPVALQDWQNIKSDFVSKPANLLRINGELQIGNYEKAILESLKIWLSEIGENATFKTCVNILRKNYLVALAEKLENNASKIQDLQVSCVTSGLLPWDTDLSPLSIWFNMSDPVNYFNGRLLELKKLHSLVTERNNEEDTCLNLITCVYGLGGIGKSALVRSYAWKQKEFYQHVVWLDCGDVGNIEKQFRSLAEELGVAKETLEIRRIVKNVYNWFNTGKKCLFVFDNVEEFVDISKILPDGIKHKPYLVVTSRIYDNTLNRKALKLDVLSVDDSVNLVQSSLPSTSPEVAQKLSKRLGHFPLALKQALAYIAVDDDQDSEVQDFLDEYKTNADKILKNVKFVNFDNYKKSVYVTWRVTLRKIQTLEFGELAIKLLHYMAYMSSDNITINFLKQLITNLNYYVKENYSMYFDEKPSPLEHIFTFIQKMMVTQYHEVNEKSFKMAWRHLQRYSMISNQNTVLRVHRLVQDVVRVDCAHHGKEMIIVDQIMQLVETCLESNQFTEQAMLHGAIASKFSSKDKQYQYSRFREEKAKRKEDIDRLMMEMPESAEEEATKAIHQLGANKVNVGFMKCAEMPISIYLDVNEKLIRQLPIEEHINALLRDWAKKTKTLLEKMKVAKEIMEYLPLLHCEISIKFLTGLLKTVTKEDVTIALQELETQHVLKIGSAIVDPVARYALALTNQKQQEIMQNIFEFLQYNLKVSESSEIRDECLVHGLVLTSICKASYENEDMGKELLKTISVSLERCDFMPVSTGDTKLMAKAQRLKRFLTSSMQEILIDFTKIVYEDCDPAENEPQKELPQLQESSVILDSDEEEFAKPTN